MLASWKIAPLTEQAHSRRSSREREPPSPWDDDARRPCRRPDDRQHATADDEWAAIRPTPPVQVRTGRPRTADPRKAADAVRQVLATGRQRRALPPRSPLRSTDRRRFRGRRRDGALTTALNRFRALAGKHLGRETEPTADVIDSRPAKTAASGGPSGRDTGRKARGASAVPRRASRGRRSREGASRGCAGPGRRAGRDLVGAGPGADFRRRRVFRAEAAGAAPAGGPLRKPDRGHGEAGGREGFRGSSPPAGRGADLRPNEAPPLGERPGAPRREPPGMAPARRLPVSASQGCGIGMTLA